MINFWRSAFFYSLLWPKCYSQSFTECLYLVAWEGLLQASLTPSRVVTPKPTLGRQTPLGGRRREKYVDQDQAYYECGARGDHRGGRSDRRGCRCIGEPCNPRPQAAGMPRPALAAATRPRPMKGFPGASLGFSSRLAGSAICSKKDRCNRHFLALQHLTSSYSSITSSARSRIDGGTARPSAFAVLRFTAISNLVGNCTGRSPGFSPRRMRST
jgi:hypothetical protein